MKSSVNQPKDRGERRRASRSGKPRGNDQGRKGRTDISRKEKRGPGSGKRKNKDRTVNKRAAAKREPQGSKDERSRRKAIEKIASRSKKRKRKKGRR